MRKGWSLGAAGDRRRSPRWWSRRGKCKSTAKDKDKAAVTLEFTPAEVVAAGAGGMPLADRVLRPAGGAAHRGGARQGRRHAAVAGGGRGQPGQGRPADRRDRPGRPAEPRRRARAPGSSRRRRTLLEAERQPHRQRSAWRSRTSSRRLRCRASQAHARRGARPAEVGAGAARRVARRPARGGAGGADRGHGRQAPRRARREGQRRAADADGRRPGARSNSPARSARTRCRCSRPGQAAAVRIEGQGEPVRAASTASRRPPRPARAAIGVVVVLDNKDERFRAGQYAQAAVELADDGAAPDGADRRGRPGVGPGLRLGDREGRAGAPHRHHRPARRGGRARRGASRA